MSVVLDASALIAVLKEEPGADIVASVMPTAVIGAANYSEVVAHFTHLGISLSTIDTVLADTKVPVSPIDHSLARDAGHLRAITATAGLSLGDRFCLALARRERLPAYTADRAWLRIADAVGVEVVPIR